jgi:hypothetical protein
VAGQENFAADTLSRPPVPFITSSFTIAAEVYDLCGIAACQLSCPSMLQASKSPSLQVSACEVEGVSLLGEASTGRPLNLKKDRSLVFKAIHNLAHPGVSAAWRLVSARFLWSGMNSDIASWCTNCVSCQHAKVTKQPRASLQPIPIPQRRFSHVYMELVGPLPVSINGFTRT